MEITKDMAEALALWQENKPKINLDSTATIKGMTKSGKPYEYDFKYASLPNIIEQTKKPLIDSGLIFTQLVDDGYLRTLLIAKDGCTIESKTPLPMTGTAQDNGKLITYYKRYALTAMLAIAAEDDTDGPEETTVKPLLSDLEFSQIKEAILDGRVGQIVGAMKVRELSVDQIYKLRLAEIEYENRQAEAEANQAKK